MVELLRSYRRPDHIQVLERVDTQTVKMSLLDTVEESQNQSPQPAQTRNIPQGRLLMRKCPQEDVENEQDKVGDNCYAE